MLPAYYMSNRNGIPRIQSTAVNVSTAAVSFTFRNAGTSLFAGLLLVNLAQAIPDGTTGTLPVQFGNVQLKKFDGEDATVADIPGTGIYLVYYDSSTGLLQLLNAISA